MFSVQSLDFREVCLDPLGSILGGSPTPINQGLRPPTFLGTYTLALANYFFYVGHYEI